MNYSRYILVALLLSFSIVYSSQAQVISTVAGPGNKIYNTNDSSFEILNAITNPNGLAVDDTGNLYIGEYYDAGELFGSVFKFKPDRKLNTAGGSVTHGGSVNLLPRSKRISYPHGIFVDPAGNIFVAEYSNHIIRKITPGGNVITIAGTGVQGFSGDGGNATAARLSLPNGVAVDNAGNFFFADEVNHVIRKVTPGGIISTFAGTGEDGYRGDGGPARQAKLNRPYGVATDNAGNVYFADTYNNVIRKVSRDGTISTVAGDGREGYVGNGTPATEARLSKPAGIATDDLGNIYVADEGNNVVRKISVNGIITTVAGNGGKGSRGDGGSAVAAQLSSPRDVAIDHNGDLYIADFGNHVIRRVKMPPPPLRLDHIATAPLIAAAIIIAKKPLSLKKVPVLKHSIVPTPAELPASPLVAIPTHISKRPATHVTPPPMKRLSFSGPATLAISPAITVSATPAHQSAVLLAPPVIKRPPVAAALPVTASPPETLPVAVAPQPLVAARLPVMAPAAVHIPQLSITAALVKLPASPDPAHLRGIAVPFRMPSLSGAPYNLHFLSPVFLPVAVAPVFVDRISCPISIPAQEETDVPVVPPPPPPVDDKVNIAIDADGILTIQTESNAYISFTITNMEGKKMVEQSIKGKQTEIDAKKLPPGSYFVDLKSKDKNRVLRFVKEN